MRADSPLLPLSAVAMAVIALFQAAGAHAADADLKSLPAVTIIGSTPLPGIGLERDQIPSAVQTATAQDLENSGATDLADFLNRSLGSVHINEVQGNPFMADVNYRGYTASPLLGTPQGLSVYLDGIRQNQAFGDVVMWDLIPKAAISSVSLMPGSNPLFGLNTLGGALSLQTKDGRKNAGNAAEVAVGSFGRRTLQLEHGGSNAKGLDWFLTGNLFRESGWRDDSPSRLGQLFGKLGWRDTQTQLNLSYGHANTTLNGNGLQEAELLAVNRASVFTKPDTTDTRAHFLNLQAQHTLSDTLFFSGNAYYRNTRTSTLNGDLNGDSLGESVYYTGQAGDKAWLSANGYGTPANEGNNAKTNAANTFPQWRCIAQAGQNIEPNEKCNGLINTTSTRQQNHGLAGQFTFLNEDAHRRNQAVVGAAYDASNVQFTQASQFGYLNADRSITAVNAFADGTQASENAYDQRVKLDGQIRTWSVFGTNTLSLHDTWHITASGRYNATHLKNTDGLYPYNNATTQGEQRGSLDGDHVFKRFNPALGVSYTPSKNINAYIGYSEGSRTPTSIELGCADPAFGCRLPNSMAGDPALKQVVSKSWEAGLRGKLNPQTAWNVGIFRGDNTDEILFVANSASTGYFKNFGKTRREGLEAGVSTAVERLKFGINYTYLKATYQSQDVLGSAYNSNADANGGITVHPGDRIPLIPAQMLKAQVSYPVLPNLTAGVSMVAVSSSFVRGNENNAHVPNGVNSLGAGRVPGYAVFNFSGSYSPSKQLKLFANVSNLFNRQYATAGQLGPYAITPTGGYRNSDTMGTSYFAPGAPRSLLIGARYTFL